jgi:outer membrane protein assembly factor BamB
MINTTITIFSNRIFFLESRNAQVLDHPTGRIPLKDLTAADLYLVALDAASGAKQWERRLDLKHCENIVYLSAAQGLLALVGSGISSKEDARYFVQVFDASTGEERWSAAHDHGKPGALGHGEQVHHPVILGDLLVTEPVIYSLGTGRPYSPAGDEDRWRILRPGHSCGTMSGAGSCLFFRADNPTVLDVRRSQTDRQRYQKLAPSRTGCWINMIPANGLLLIPEASAGCVCAYPIQTSMAFRATRPGGP